jgi:ferredoxin/flavodoxin---NADP+ reductase
LGLPRFIPKKNRFYLNPFMGEKNKQIVAVVGGAVAGSEMVKSLTDRGITCVVIDQNVLPHGKIEDGLPKWHAKQRDNEELLINQRLNHPLVHYIPSCKLGRDISFEELLSWNLSAIVLATGAWKDRPLPIEGIDDYVNKGLYYQNPFVYWYNHKHEPGYSGQQYEIADDAIIIGGGLASIDVAKIVMMELVGQKLKERGIETDLFQLNHGIIRVLEKNNLKFEELGINGCTLYYRRRDVDMPLANATGNTPEQLLKAQTTRQRMLANYMSKFFFRFQPCSAPVDKVVEDGKLTGIVFRKTDADEKKCVEIEGSDTAVHAPLVISSIGSIPEPIPGALTQGSTFKITDEESCRMQGYDNVFIVGNAVTGKGNIRDSLLHAKHIAAWMNEHFFPQAEHLPDTTFNKIIAGVKQLQQKQGYSGNYAEWAETHTPIRIENMGGIAAMH